MAKFLYTQKEFELIAQFYDLCCALNQDCVGQSHCKDRWDDFLDEVNPNYPKGEFTRESSVSNYMKRTVVDIDESYSVPFMIKDLIRRLG